MLLELTGRIISPKNTDIKDRSTPPKATGKPTRKGPIPTALIAVTSLVLERRTIVITEAKREAIGID